MKNLLIILLIVLGLSSCDPYERHPSKYNGLFQQAKQVEKQQIIDAYSKGNEDGYSNGSYITGEQYYTNTFKQE